MVISLDQILERNFLFLRSGGGDFSHYKVKILNGTRNPMI